MSANDRQVGGDHYKRDYQHWDLMAELGTPYLPGVLTKYVERHPKKEGRKDLEKSVHYAEKWLETEQPELENVGSVLEHMRNLMGGCEQRVVETWREEKVFDYCLRAGLDTQQTIIFHAALVQEDPARALHLCQQYLEKSYTQGIGIMGSAGPEAVMPRLGGRDVYESLDSVLGDGFLMFIGLDPAEIMKRDLTSRPGSPEDGDHHAGRSASPFAPPGFSGRTVPRA